jgi:hypothetical protein
MLNIQSINEAFENYREERFIANKIKEDFDKVQGKKTLLLKCSIHSKPSIEKF